MWPFENVHAACRAPAWKRSATDAIKERLLQPQRMPPTAPAASPTVVTVASQQQPAAARSSSANRSSAPSSPQPPPLRRLQIAMERRLAAFQGFTHGGCRGVHIHPSSPAPSTILSYHWLRTMATHIPREYPRTLSWTAGGCACAIRESHRTLKLTLAISTLCSLHFSPGMRPEVSTDERGKSTQQRNPPGTRPRPTRRAAGAAGAR